MTWSWFSERLGASLAIALTLAWIGWFLAAPAAAHPELEAQIERLDEQLTTDPGNVSWLVRRGDLHRRHGEFEAAAADFQAARALTPNDPELDFYEGRLALEAGEPARAEQLLDRYLSTHPDQASAWRLRALASRQQGNFRAAADGFSRAVAASDTPSPALYRDWILALQDEGDHAAALVVVDQGLSRIGTEVSLIGLGADLALLVNEPMRACAYLERLPDGLESRSPWRERRQMAHCAQAPADPQRNSR